MKCRGARKCVGCIECQRELWVIRAREGGRRDTTCSEPMAEEDSAVKTRKLNFT
jgi:hypothetical protein